MDAQEAMDLVDDQDRVIGEVDRYEFQKMINNPPGNVRAAENVQKGETYRQAMVRGLAEELNMTVEPDDLEQATLLPPEPSLPVFRAIFLYRTDQTPHYNPEDFSGGTWLTPQTTANEIAGGEPAKSTLITAIRAVFLDRQP